MKLRNEKLDWLRTIGLLGIIVAHISPPDIIINIRTFDVPLMVVISGLSYKYSFSSELSIGRYFLKRLKRLLVPTWIFLLFYFIYFYGLQRIFDRDPTSFRIVVNSFLLLNEGGIGYLWIIRVFILISMSAPLIDVIKNIVNNNSVFLTLIIFGLVMYCILIERDINSLLIIYNSNTSIFIMDYLIYMVPYSFIFWIGYMLPKTKLRHLFYALIPLSITLILPCWHNGSDVFLSIDSYKYPPRGPWVLYGIVVSTIFFLQSIGYCR